MAKLKPQKTKPTKKKKNSNEPAGQSNKTILSFLYLPIAILIVAIGSAAYFLIQTQMAPVNQKHRDIMVSAYASQFELIINNAFDQHTALLDEFASSPDVIRAAAQNNPGSRRPTELRLASQLPAGLTVHISPIRMAEPSETSNPPLSHAGLDMIRQVEQGIKLSAEVHNYNDSAYLQSVRPVFNEAGNLIGTIATTQSLSYLADQLKGIDASKGHLLIQQQFENGPLQTVTSIGAKNNNLTIPLTSSNKNWSINFQPSNQLLGVVVLETSLAWILFGALAAICCITIFVAGQRLQAALRHDANAFAKQVLDSLTRTQPNASTFEFAIFNSLGKTINRMRMGKLPASAQAFGSSGGADASALPSNSVDDSQDFDVSMMEDDSDLLGMTNDRSEAAPIDIHEAMFSAQGILGIVGQSMTNEAAIQIGRAIGSEAHDRGAQTIIVGRDGRLSSPELAQSLIRGLVASGRNVIDIGVVPTPVVYFALKHLNTDSCIVVTGGQHPANYNGFKVLIRGNELLPNEIKGLYHRVANQNFQNGAGNSTTQDISAEYLADLKSNIKAPRALKVVVDCGNGVASNLVPAAIKGIGSHVLPLFCDVDGNFPNHLPNPTDPKNLQDLTRTVSETRADIGLAFNGDGTQMVIVTNSGQVISPDRIMMILAKHLLQTSPGQSVLFDVDSSRRLTSLISAYGGKPVIWKAGQSNLLRKMKDSQAALGGSIDGHIFYQDRWYGFDDAIYAAARLIEVIANQSETIDTLLRELPIELSTPRMLVSTTDERKDRIIEAMQRSAQFPGGQIVDIDGIRVEFPNGWGLVRASKTQPALVCRFEAENEAALKQIKTLFRQQLLTVDSQLKLPF